MSHSITSERAHEPVIRFRDNPIGIAQARRRLRPKQAIPTLIVVGILAMCALLFGVAGAVEDEPSWTGARNFLIVIFAVVLYLGGTNHVASAVADDRRNGLLDFHRATPTTSWTDSIGYVVGSAAREYASAILLIPFISLTTLLAGESLVAAVIGMAVVVLSGWLYHVFGMFSGLSSRRSRVHQSTVAGVVFLFFIAAPFVAVGTGTIAHLTPMPALASLGLFGNPTDVVPSLDFYGVPMSQVAFTILLQGYLLAFLFWASARKLRREGTPAFSRPAAYAFFLFSVVILLGPSWSRLNGEEAAGLGVAIYMGAAVAFACGLGLALVPKYMPVVRAMRRARREGRALSPLDDGAPIWSLVPVLTILITFGMGALIAGVMAHSDLTASHLLGWEAGVTLMAAASFLAFVVGSSEYLHLKLRKASRSGAFLVGFVTLVLPWILGLILGTAGVPFDLVGFVFALSPIFCVGASIAYLAESWTGGLDQDLEAAHLFFSLAVTVFIAGWFLWRSAQLRRAIAREGSSVDA